MRVCVRGGHPARSKLPSGGGHLRLVYRSARRSLACLPCTHGAGLPSSPQPHPSSVPREGEGCVERGLKRRWERRGVRRQEMLIRSRVKQPPPSGLQVGSVQAQAVTGRRENYIIPCSSDATFRAATMRAGKQPGARLAPPRLARCYPGGGGGELGAERRAPASLTHTHTRPPECLQRSHRRIVTSPE